MKTRSLVLLSLAFVAAACQDSEPKPNLIVISLDTLRAQSLGAYGYVRETSPFFDQLASEGVLFDNAITTSVTTPPSHMSLFTGLYPVRHGIITGLEQRLAADVPRITTTLRSNGYFTKAITENGFLIRRVGFDEGFDEYSEHFGKKKRSAPGLVHKSFGEAREWLEEEHDEPYFLFLHTYQVHAPYRPPVRYNDRFVDDGHSPTEEGRYGRVLDRYDREIAYLDDELKRLFDVIAQRKTKRETIVLIVSDHGEEFLEHGAVQHGTHVFEESVRIPMLFWGDKIPKGRRVTGQVSLIDAFPTLMELIGLAVPTGLDGVSLAKVIAGSEEPPVRPLFTEARARREWRAGMVAVKANPIEIGVRFDGRKFVVHRPEGSGEQQPTLTFDLEKDPREAKPIELPTTELVPIEGLVDDYLATVQVRKGAAGPERSEAEFKKEADPALIERLRSLGYVE